MSKNNTKKKQKPLSKTKRSNGFGMIALFVIVIAVIVILTNTLHSTEKPATTPREKGHTVKIKEIKNNEMIVVSESDALGRGEITIQYDEKIVVEDVNGQIIDFAELSAGDRIEVIVKPASKDEKTKNKPTVANKLILLPDDSNTYV